MTDRNGGSPDGEARLEALDATFIEVERDGAHMHIGGVLRCAGDPPAFDDLVAAVERRLHLLPRYRQRLAFVPFGASFPVWVDDTAFDVRCHVRHVSLPDPGSEADLQTLTGWMFSQPLDHGRPLWELWLVDGCADGGFALVSKLHHCMVDGIASVNIATVLFDTEPVPPDAGAPAKPWTPQPPPSAGRMLAGAAAHLVTAPARLAASATLASLRDPRAAAARGRRTLAGLAAFTVAALRPAPTSAYNRPTGGQRRLVSVRVDLATVKTIRTALGGTLNDVVLATVAGALRRHLLQRGERVDGVQLKVMVPVSVRTVEETELGNRITTLWTHLPVGVADPVARLRQVNAAMNQLKRGDQVLGSQALTGLLDLVPPILTAPVARMLASPRTFNVTVTNVPGPTTPLFVLGRPLVDIVPVVPLAGGHALGVAIMSYQGGLTFGLLGDHDAMPDLEELVSHVQAALAELEVAAERAADGAAAAELVGTPRRRRPAPAARTRRSR